MDSQTNENFEGMSRKRFWKFVFGFIAIILVGFIIFPLTYNYYRNYEVQKGFDNYFEAEKNYQDALKNDTFGGKTPQETYEMFIEVLKTGNILDAAKFYFYDSDRIKSYERFEKMRSDGSLASWIAALPNWSQMNEVEYWDKDGKEFEYEYIQEEDYIYYEDAIDRNRVIPAGKYIGNIIFQLNNSANIWKIYQL